MTFRMPFNTQAIACVLLSVGLSPVQAHDFTVRGTGDDAVDLPQRLTAGTWFYTVTYQTNDDDAPSFWLDSVDTQCDGSTLEELSASATDKRLTVGPYPANICAGWHEVDPIDFQLRNWSIRFVKEGGGGQPPRLHPQRPVTARCRTVSSAYCSARPRTANALTASKPRGLPTRAYCSGSSTRRIRKLCSKCSTAVRSTDTGGWISPSHPTCEQQQSRPQQAEYRRTRGQYSRDPPVRSSPAKRATPWFTVLFPRTAPTTDARSPDSVPRSRCAMRGTRKAESPPSTTRLR